MCMHYTIYQITNLVNGNIYIGAHKTKDLEDGYMGSGKILTRAIKKHSLDNFNKEIIAVFDSADEMFTLESELVNEDFIKRKDTYNIKLGGHGGFDYINETKTREDRVKHSRLGYVANKQIMRCPVKNKFAGGKSYKLKAGVHAATKEQHTKWCKLRTEAALTDEAKAKRIASLKKIKHQQGSRNSQFGTMWVTNGFENKKILKTQPIEGGWVKGRTMRVQ